MLLITTAIKLNCDPSLELHLCKKKSLAGSHNIRVHVDSSYVVFNLKNCFNGGKMKIQNQHGTEHSKTLFL